MCLICDRIKMIKDGTTPYFVKELETMSFSAWVTHICTGICSRG